MRFNTLAEWLSWLEGFHPTQIDLGLQRISCVATRMGLGKPARYVVTVAGTNGKGSCVATLESILHAAGLQVGSYTSPHLLRYNERVKINGEPVSDDNLCQAMAQVDAALGGESLTYFEFGTLAALLLFEQQSLDVVVLEVGLGGRLDAVNIVDPDIAVITSIDIDHVAWLGSEREQIAAEKAGVLRANIPLVVTDEVPTSAVYQRAQELGCKVYQYGTAFGFDKSTSSDQGLPDELNWFGQSADGAQLTLRHLPFKELPRPSLAGAIQCAVLLQDSLKDNGLLVGGLSDETIRKGLSQTYLAGRMQTIHYQGMEVLLDVAHNLASVKYLADWLGRSKASGRTLALFAVMADKDISGMLAVMKPWVDVWILPQLSVSRACPAMELESQMRDQGIKDTLPCKNVSEGFTMLRERYEKGDRVLVFGSFFTVADTLSVMQD